MPDGRGARFGGVLTLAALGVLAVFGWRRCARRRAHGTAPKPLVVAAAERPARDARDRPLKLAEAAVLYERAVIELSDLSEDAKLRALSLLAHVIVPLVGDLAVEDLPAVVAGVRRVLGDENDDEPGVLVVWTDFARWSHSRLLGSRLR